VVGSILIKDFDIKAVLHELAAYEATSIALLREEFRQALLDEAGRYVYHAEPEVVGSADRIVRQQMGSKSDLPPGSLYLRLKDEIQRSLGEGLRQAAPYPFESLLRFNDLSLQKYAAGSIGITPHRDGLKYINLICIVVIGGQGRFFVCADRSGRAAREIEAEPGKAIFLRAPGFLGEDNRPFHMVREITETRYSFGLRQKRQTVLDAE
jgi:hypothetical protein